MLTPPLEHVPCVRCEYDLFGARDVCPECGLAIEHSHQPKRLLFAPRAGLAAILFSFVMDLVGLAVWAVYIALKQPADSRPIASFAEFFMSD